MDAARPPIARFVTGSTMRHVVVMTLTSSVGLMALFLVDLASLFFLNLLARTEITAAIGYAGAIAFTNLSLSLGLGIAASALVSRSLGARELEKARRYATSALAATRVTYMARVGSPTARRMKENVTAAAMAGKPGVKVCR